MRLSALSCGIRYRHVYTRLLLWYNCTGWLGVKHQLAYCTQLWHNAPAWPCLATALTIVVNQVCLSVCLPCVTYSTIMAIFAYCLLTRQVCLSLCSCMCTFWSITQQVCLSLCSCMCKFLSITQRVTFYLSPGSAALPCLATTSLTDRCDYLTFHWALIFIPYHDVSSASLPTALALLGSPTAGHQAEANVCIAYV